jgi:AcrR family transcriptional regulator
MGASARPEPKVAPEAGAKRLGRPPKVTPEQIAQAALEIGLEHATVRNVAEHLGMSVPGLYYYVRTREELLAMAAAHGLGDLPLPADVGQPAVEWLLDYARFVYDALVAQPELIGQILAGTYNTVRMTQHLEGFFTVLVARGYSVDEAYAANRHLTEAIIGAAASTIGRDATVDAGHPLQDDLRRAIKALGRDTVPLVDALVRTRGFPRTDPFDTVRLVATAIDAAHRTAARAARPH